jgi:hypothetical protein
MGKNFVVRWQFLMGYLISYLDFLGEAINIPLKIANERQSSFPLAV